MASTSSSIVNASTGKFDVFINHRGPDVKNSLASIIYTTLDFMKVRAFLDREELQAGENISDAIKEAISDALVHIAIFSPNYAQSSWCLDELTLMLRTGKKIIPIFYNVEPSDLRWVAQGKGVYAETFSKHEKRGRYPPQKLEEWKKALSEVSEVSGYVHKPENDEGLLLKNIINDVIADMRHKPLLDVATHPVGLDEAIKEFQNFVETQCQCAESRDNVKIVGITGLGGSGKTTLVKEYFNRKRSPYTQSSFLSEVRDAAAKNRLHDLQKQLLEDLMHVKEEIHDTSAGKGTLERRLRSVKALIVLDDVDHINQIEALLPLKGNLQPDSLVIVTTRDSGVITSSASLSRSVCVFLYRKRALDPVYAKQLFCWHAFLRDSPEKGFEDLVEEFLYACQGLPLSLKVLGAQLFGNNNRDYWESVLREISNILPDEIRQRLKVSYDALDEKRQQMFLDIACFFIGEQKDMAISIWDGSSSDGVPWSSWYGFQILSNKCLVEVDHENCIRMHDHLRDLGREVAIEKNPSRFWSHSQFINSHRPLEERLPIRGIMAATGSYGYCNMHYEPPFEECMQLLRGHSTSRSRKCMSSALGLQLLAVRGDYFKKRFRKLSEELVWLRWYDFPHRKLPSWLSTGKLRILELYQAEGLAELWGPNDVPPPQLRELIIHFLGCKLQMIPKTIVFLKHLKKIELNAIFARQPIEISSLPEEFCFLELERLEHLELLQFSYLSSLPTNFGNLRKLKYINLSGCQRLTALPVSFNRLTELQYLDLSGCSDLLLEKSILENITKLEELRLHGCSRLQQLPGEITRQTYLRKLCLSSTGLRELPADIDRLAKLEVLEIGGPCLTSLPASLENLSSLISLEIKDCRELKYFPSVGNLSCLIQLTISDCRELTHLPPVECLTRLENLKLESSGVEYLPDGFGHLVNLQKLEISDCPIRELRLANPEERYSKKPRLLNHVDSSKFKCPRLKSIHLSETKVSTVSVSEDCCPSLEDLSLCRNNDLMEIETLPTTLKSVDIFVCLKLKNIRCIAGLAKLHDLKIASCPRLDQLLSFAGLVELQRLYIEECPIRGFRLANPEERYSKKPRRYSKKPRLLNPVNSSMFKFMRLKRIRLCGTKVSTISKPRRYYKKPRLLNHVDSSTFKCPRLKSIHLSGTKGSIVSVSEECCPSLEDLDLRWNDDLMEIETLPATLKSVVIFNCQKLKNIRCVAGLVELRDLEIQKCPELDELPCFACCACLEKLKIDVSSRITKIEGKLKNLYKLNTLQIRGESRSAIERCIPPNIEKRAWACRMDIVGRTVEDAESIVESFSFPNFTVVDEVHSSSVGRWEMKARLSNARCVIACFVISCHVDGIVCDVVGSSGNSYNYMRLLEGRQLFVVVWPFDLNDDFMDGRETAFLKFGTCGTGCVEPEKGMAVIMRKGEEDKASEVLNTFLEL